MEDVFVATDDQRIYDAVVAFGGKAIMTRSDHKSGTDRICEALEKVGGGFDVVINIQGDEPFIQKSQLETVMQCFDDPRTQIATLGKPFESMEAVENPNSPKIVLDTMAMLLFSHVQLFLLYVGKNMRNGSLISLILKHIGLYAYRTEVLREISKLPQSTLELAESLEQLRWLQNGYKIKGRPYRCRNNRY